MLKLVSLCLCLSFLSPSPATAAEFRWADVYKAGPVKLSPDPAFGQGVDWGSFLFECFKDIAVADDGTIFMANSREHTIHKFDSSGHKVLTFGQKGQGPGDLESPNTPSILDGKYLVVGEYASNHRISLFDLSGKFFKLLKTERPAYSVAAVGGTKIAYLAKQFEQGNAGQRKPGIMLTPMTIRVVLKDIETGGEQVLLTRTVQQKFILFSQGQAISFGDNTTGGGVFLARTADGGLAVGIGNSPNVDIYDAGGKLLRSIVLHKTPQPATSEYIARYKKSQIDKMRKDWEKIPTLRKAIEDIEGYDFSKFFDEPLPIFTDMKADAEGNLLFFHRSENPGETCFDFSAYSAGGELIAETRLDPGPFALSLDSRFICLCFAKGGLIGLAPLKNDEDQLPVLFRSVPNPKK